MQRRAFAFGALALLAISGWVSAHGDSSPLFGGYFEDSKCSTPYATAASSHNLQTLAAAIKAAGLTSTLDSSSAAITVFAPTDDAFSALASALSLTPAELLAKSDLLKKILEYHVYAVDAYEESDFDKHSTLTMLEGETIKIESVGDIYTIEPAAGATATILVEDLSACKAYLHIIDTVLIPKAVATAAGTDSILVPGAGVMESQAVTSAVGKKTGAATPVPTVLVPVVPVVTHTPAATVPPVAVSGARTTPLPAVTGLTPVLTPPVLTAAATPVETVLVPAATPAATKQTIKDLLMDKHTPTLTPVETILDPADTTVPAVAVSGARSVPTITPAPILIPAVEPTPEATKAVEHPLLGVLTGKKIIDTPTPTPQATKAVTHPVLGVLLGKEVTSASTPVPTILVPATPAATIPILIPSTPIATIPAVTLPAAITPAVIVSGARSGASPSPVPLLPVVEAVAPAVQAVATAVGNRVDERTAAVAPARAAVAQAATAVRDDRAARLGLATPVPTAVPAVVVAQAGPDVMVPAMAPEAAMGMIMAPEIAMGAQQGPTAMDMMTPAMAPGSAAGFAALTALKTNNPSPCVTALEAAKMVPELSDFVNVVTATDQSSMLNDASLVATIFAPTNDAFNTVLSQYGITTQQALSQPSLLKGLLQYHVVANLTLTTAAMTNGQILPTALSGQTLKVIKSGSTVTIQPATGSPANIMEADVPVCMAELDVIDTLLFPAASALPAGDAALLSGRTAASG